MAMVTFVIDITLNMQCWMIELALGSLLCGSECCKLKKKVGH